MYRPTSCLCAVAISSQLANLAHHHQQKWLNLKMLGCSHAERSDIREANISRTGSSQKRKLKQTILLKQGNDE
jgi:hypothetical protein